MLKFFYIDDVARLKTDEEFPALKEIAAHAFDIYYAIFRLPVCFLRDPCDVRASVFSDVLFFFFFCYKEHLFFF